MTEKEKNRAHFLLDCLENNGQITLNKEDMVSILKLNREITIDEFARAINSRLLRFVHTDYDDIMFIAEQLKEQK